MSDQAKLDKATLLHAADIAQGLVRAGEAGEIEETLRRLAGSLQNAAPQVSPKTQVEGSGATYPPSAVAASPSEKPTLEPVAAKPSGSQGDAGTVTGNAWTPCVKCFTLEDCRNGMPCAFGRQDNPRPAQLSSDKPQILALVKKYGFFMQQKRGAEANETWVRIIAALDSIPSATREIPAELFDGPAVFVEIGMRGTVSSSQVSSVLDAVVRLIRKNRADSSEKVDR